MFLGTICMSIPSHITLASIIIQLYPFCYLDKTDVRSLRCALVDHWINIFLCWPSEPGCSEWGPPSKHEGQTQVRGATDYRLVGRVCRQNHLTSQLLKKCGELYGVRTRVSFCTSVLQYPFDWCNFDTVSVSLLYNVCICLRCLAYNY